MCIRSDTHHEIPNGKALENATVRDPHYFAQVRIDSDAGTIAWPDGIDLAPEPLYEQAHAHPLVAA